VEIVEVLKGFTNVAATIFITALFFGFKQMWKNVKGDLKAHVAEHKTDIMIEIGLINSRINVNEALDEVRDQRLKEMREDLKEIKSNLK